MFASIGAIVSSHVPLGNRPQTVQRMRLLMAPTVSDMRVCEMSAYLPLDSLMAQITVDDRQY